MKWEFSLNRKETFSVSMVIFIGFFYLLSLFSALFQSSSISLHQLFGVTELKFFFLGIFYWSGAICFFRLKNPGWVICTATLLNFVMVVSQFVLSVTQSPRFDGAAAIVVSSFLLILLSFIFLFNKPTREKFAVNNKSYLLVLCVYLMLLAITFLL